MSLTKLLIPTYVQMLQTLSGLIEKAQQQLPQASVNALLSTRLAPDMLPLSSQLNFAVFQAQEAVFRLRGETIPEWLHEVAVEGRNANAVPGSMSEVQTRITEALTFLKQLDQDALDGCSDHHVAIELPNDLVFDMTGDQYARDWALPQFYFHVVTAYAILRSQGIEIGKADYVPHMSAYRRISVKRDG